MTFVRTCTSCGTVSETIYRCDGCGGDLTDSESPVWEFEYASVDGRRDDGLVRVEIPVECIDCETTRYLPLQYRHVGRVVRLGCPTCREQTKHRPVGADCRRAAAAMFDGDTEPAADHNPSISTPL